MLGYTIREAAHWGKPPHHRHARYHPGVTEDLYPAYIAFIRRELKLLAGSDALVELAARLHPEDARAKPPYRAPGIVRLRRALRRLERHKPPDSSLEEFARDLRFLQMFALDQPILPADAMQKLLSDVMNSPPIKKTGTGGTDNELEADQKVVPFRSKARPQRESP